MGTAFPVVLAILAIFLVVIAFRGKSDNLIAAFVGHQWGKSTLA